MKRLAGIMALAAVTVLMTATAALADYPVTDDTSVEGAGGGTGGTAFTGSDVSMAAVAIAALLVVGLTALFVARRHSARVAV
jgi:hypothetical protein